MAPSFQTPYIQTHQVAQGSAVHSGQHDSHIESYSLAFQ